jgi:hypothetical protein
MRAIRSHTCLYQNHAIEPMRKCNIKSLPMPSDNTICHDTIRTFTETRGSISRRDIKPTQASVSIASPLSLDQICEICLNRQVTFEDALPRPAIQLAWGLITSKFLHRLPLRQTCTLQRYEINLNVPNKMQKNYRLQATNVWWWWYFNP